MRKSILQKNIRCLVCGRENNIHCHEVFFGTANRAKSIEDGMVVYLCGKHHNLSSEGVHSNRTLDLSFKRMAQDRWEKTYGSKDDFRKAREDFIKRYGKSWL